MEYHIDNLKSVTVARLTVFQEEEKGTFKYERLVIDDGYGTAWNMKKPKFGFVFERVDKMRVGSRCYTMTKFKACVQYLELVNRYYDSVDNDNAEIFIDEEEQIYVQAQILSDICNSNFGGSDCSLYLKLIGFRCIKKD